MVRYRVSYIPHPRGRSSDRIVDSNRFYNSKKSAQRFAKHLNIEDYKHKARVVTAKNKKSVYW